MPFIAEFSKKNPDVNFEVHDGITYTLYDYLQEGIIDISVVRTPLRLDDVESAVLHSEPMIAVSNPEMPSERRKSLILEELVHRPLILYRRYEMCIRDSIIRNLSCNDIIPCHFFAKIQ